MLAVTTITIDFNIGISISICISLNISICFNICFSLTSTKQKYDLWSGQSWIQADSMPYQGDSFWGLLLS